MTFDFAYAWEILPALLVASLTTIQATIMGFLLALVIGLVIELLRRAPSRPVAICAAAFNECVRTTPLLVQLYFLYFVGPNYGITLDPLTTGVLALGIHYGAYLSEVYRSGLNSVAKGQAEACISLNLTPCESYRHVILPQAVAPMFPVFCNYLIAMFKETPLLSSITVMELLLRAKLIASESFRYLEPITMVGIIFLILSLAASDLVRRGEKLARRRVKG